MTVLMVVELVGAVHLDVRQIEPPVSIDSAGDKLVAVDEDELAGVKPHGPPPCRPGNVCASNVDPDPGHLPEIVDNHTALLRDRSGVDTHRHVYRKPRPRSTHGCFPPGPNSAQVIGAQHRRVLGTFGEPWRNERVGTI